MPTHKGTSTKSAGTPADGPNLEVVPTFPTTPARTDTQSHLWAAAKARSDSTTAELAIAARIGRSTAGKILAAWAKDGTVTRTPGDVANGRRTPDRWAINAPGDTVAPGDGSTDAGAETNSEGSTDQKSSTPTRDDRPDLSVVATSVDGEPSDEATDDVDHADPADRAVSADMSATSEKGGPISDAAPGSPGATETTPDRSVAAGNGQPLRDEPVLGAKSPRLQSGALRGLVEDYLRDHATDAFGPSAIGRALNRSAGAVNNALEKLVESGYAQRVQDTPKRFQFNASPESPIT